MNKSANSAGLYRTLWRWHFYAGLFCIPFVLTLAVSGAIYLFKPQFEHWRDTPYRNLNSVEQAATADQHIEAALSAVPQSRLTSYRLPLADTDAVVVTVDYAGKLVRVYVHPTTLQILGTVNYDSQFMQVVKKFHGELLAGNLGSILVELAGCWALVLVMTGLYLWWPRNSAGLAGVIYPRLRQGKRIFWRDLHAVTGFWVAGFTLFLLVSGLPWALVWGSALKELRQHNEHAQHQTPAADWSLRSAETAPALPSTSNRTLPEEVVQTARALNFAPPAELTPAPNQPGIWLLKSQNQNRPLRAEAQLNANGEVIKQTSFADKKRLDRIIGTAIAAHEGQLFGWFNQLLGLFTNFSLISMSVSGFILWRRRKPASILGAPPPIPNARVGKVVGGIILLMALLLPLLAISLVVILLVEFLVLRRLEGARRWLGLSA